MDKNAPANKNISFKLIIQKNYCKKKIWKFLEIRIIINNLQKQNKTEMYENKIYRK